MVTADFTAGPPFTPVGINTVALNGAPGVVKTALRGFSTQRGRQYELNKCESGTMTLDVTDTLEQLNPVNSSSPWNSGLNSLLPYRTIAAGAWWNTTTRDVTGNLLNSGNQPPASGGQDFDPSFENGTTGGWGNFGTASTLANSTAQAFTGTHSLACTFTSSADAAGFGLWTVPGQQYTASLYVFVPASHTVTATLANFPGALGTTIATATSTVTAAWQRLTLTGVPSSAISAVLVKVATGTFSATVYVDAVQAELGGTASGFTVVGPTYFPVYTGYVERYPQKWDMAGFRGLKPLEAVDALSPLSRANISQSYAQTILADSPLAVMPLDDAAFPEKVQLPQGGQPFNGSQQLGSQSGSASFAGDSFLDGTKALLLSQQNSNPSVSSDVTMTSWVGTRQGKISMNSQAFTIECWFRWQSGTIYFGIGDSDVPGPIGPTNYLGWYTAGGFLTVHYADPAVGGPTFTTNFATSGYGSVAPDGEWHYLNFRCLGGNQYQYQIDTFVTIVHTFSPAPSPSVAWTNLFLSATTYFGDPITTASFANMSIYSFALSSAQVNNHIKRGIGYLGELPGNRALRLLTKYWSAAVVTDPGKTQLSADFYYDPPVVAGQASQAKSVLSALEDIADTEMGLTWADVAGMVHFDSRDTRYLNQPTPLFVFGENEAGGELPYLNIEYDYDPTFVYSEADLTCDATQNVVTSVNSTSQTNYGQRILSKTMYAQNEWDVQQAANFYTRRYAKPAGAAGTGVPPRISAFTIDPASNPRLFAAALSLDISSRVTVKRRTSAGVTITGDYYIEQISHEVNNEESTWLVHYQLSPVFVPSVWILGDSTKGVLGTTTIPVY